MARTNKGGGNMRRRAFALLTVMLMLATAFAGLIFIGSTMIDENTSAGGGSSSSPLNSLSIGIQDADGTYYVKVGGTVNVTPNPQSGGMHVNSVTSGYGLSCTTNGGTAKSLTGTISKAGTITCTVTNFAGTTSYSSFKIVGVVSEHTIQFNRGTHGSITYGGSTSQSMTVPDGTSCTISGASLTISGYGTVTGSGQSGYEAYGWSYTGGSGTATSGSFTITQNTTIRLATRTITSYTVTISAGTGGSVSETSVSVPSGTSISTSGSTLTIGSNTITATANSGYSFSSWSNASGTVTADRTITANFASNEYTVTFNGNGGSAGSSSLTGTSITLPSASRSSTTGSTYGSTSSYTYYSVTTYTFDGWYTSSSGGTYKGGAGSTYTPTSNTTLYAHWSSSSTTYYTYYYSISYNANGGSGGPSSTDGGTSSSSSKNVTLSNSAPSRSGYTFLGWSTNQNATSASYLKGGTYTFSYGTTTLYAVWEQNKTTYYAKLTYNANGGSGAPSQQSMSGEYYSNPGSYGFTISSTTPTKSGKVFAGWSTSSTATSPSYYAGGTIYVGYSASSSDSTTLYAVWKDPTLTLYQVGQQYGVIGRTVSFSVVCNADPSGTAVGYETSNISNGLTVTTSGSNVTCSASSVGTYTFTLTAVATGYTSSSITVTVQFVPVLAFTNAPTIGVIGS